MLSKVQQRFLDLYMENPVLPMAVVAENIGIPRKTVYNWRAHNINGFKDKMDQGLEDKWQEAKQMASETMFTLAREGDFKAAKYILDYHGYQPETKVDAKVAGAVDITINITDDNGND